MSAWLIVVECLLINIPFSLMVVILLNKDPLNMIVNYPPEIQAEYYRSQNLESKKEKLTAKNYIAKAIFMVVALAVIVGLAYLAGARTFLDGFIAAVAVIVGFICKWLGGM